MLAARTASRRLPLGPGQLCVGLNRHLAGHVCRPCMSSMPPTACAVGLVLYGAAAVCFLDWRLMHLPLLITIDCGAGPARRRPRHPGRNAQNHGGRQRGRVFSHWSISVRARFSSVVCGSHVACHAWNRGGRARHATQPVLVPLPLPLPPFTAGAGAAAAAAIHSRICGGSQPPAPPSHLPNCCGTLHRAAAPCPASLSTASSSAGRMM